MSDPTAVPVVLLQLYFKRLPVVTHVFSKETGFAKHKLLTHAQSRFSPSQHWAVITDWMKHPEKGIKKKNPKWCLELSAASCFSSLNKFTRSQLFIVSPKNHKSSEMRSHVRQHSYDALWLWNSVIVLLEMIIHLWSCKCSCSFVQMCVGNMFSCSRYWPELIF